VLQKRSIEVKTVQVGSRRNFNPRNLTRKEVKKRTTDIEAPTILIDSLVSTIMEKNSINLLGIGPFGEVRNGCKQFMYSLAKLVENRMKQESYELYR